MREQKGFFGKMDGGLISIYLLLMLFGWLAIFSAEYSEKEAINIFNLSTNYGKQIMWIGVSLVMFLFIQLTSVRFFRSISPFVYALFVLSLIVVLVIGQTVAGNQSWIDLGFFKLQPSEFAKFSSALMVAYYLSTSSGKIRDLKSYGISLAIVGLPFVLVILQGDFGSALVYFGYVFVLNREGLSNWVIYIGIYAITISVLALVISPWLLALLLVLLAAIIYFLTQASNRRKLLKPILLLVLVSTIYVQAVDFIFDNALKDHHRSRINVILGKETDLSGAGYNLNQSKIAIGSGGFFGKGYLNGTQTRYDFVPELSTDFIFCTIGEEFGFIGSFVLVLLYVALLIQLLFISDRQRSDFSRIFIYGVAAIIFMHFLINISMTIGLMPVIGIPLPFFSYGGSSLISFSAMIACTIKLDSDRLLILR
jgi:rod shape determining protein RodA